MQRRTKRLNDAGRLIAFALAFYYTLTFFVYHKPLYMLFTHVLLFWAIFAVLLFNKGNLIHIIIFCVVGYMTIAMTDNGNLAGPLFICFAAQLSNRFDVSIGLGIVAVGIILAKGVVTRLETIQTVNFMIGAFAVMYYYYILNMSADKSFKVINIMNDDKILNLMIEGRNTKEIAYDMGITQSAVNKHIKKLRDENGYVNNAQLFAFYNAALLRKNGKISDNCDN